MAIFHLTAKIVQRSKGQNVVAKAAYNGRARFINKNTGKRYDFRHRGECLLSRIIVPPDAKVWVQELSQSPQDFWSAVEVFEKRKDAQIAREVEISLPYELTQKQREDLAVTFVNEMFVRKGMIADVCLHPPSPNGDTRNYHCHILLTMREIGPDCFGNKVREWNSKALLQESRVKLEQFTNRQLELHGQKVKVDHRSLKAQGIDREPLIHIGVAANYSERQGVKTKRGNKLREIKERNNRAAQKEYWSQRLAEHNRNGALENIKRDKNNNRDLNKEDIRNLSYDDRERIENYGFDYLEKIIQDWDLHRDIGGRER